MRKFKFRAVLQDDDENYFVSDGFDGQSGYLSSLFSMDCGVVIDEILCSDKFLNSILNAGNGWSIVEIQQYTGLKDINGKEIYEGDIIGIKTKNKPAYISEVLFKEGEFCYFDLDYTNKQKTNYPLNAISSEYGIDHSGSHICKVIGNIYENQKLLEDIKNG